MDAPTPLATVAVALADEGVPLRAIARATKIPSVDLRQQLHHAQLQGRLLELPREDWPPGFPRDQRALQLSRLAVENKTILQLAVQHLFKLTQTEVMLLLTLIQNPLLAKIRADMSVKTLDVHICNLRKNLGEFGLRIVTLWGTGYQLSQPDRHRAMDLILAHVAGTEPE